jgi:hypothetical protein
MTWKQVNEVVVGGQVAELAKEIKLTRDGMEIDGVAFPWYLTEEGAVPSSVNRNSLTHVTVRIPCERIVIEDSHSPPKAA